MDNQITWRRLASKAQKAHPLIDIQWLIPHHILGNHGALIHIDNDPKKVILIRNGTNDPQTFLFLTPTPLPGKTGRHANRYSLDVDKYSETMVQMPPEHSSLHLAIAHTQDIMIAVLQVP